MKNVLISAVVAALVSMAVVFTAGRDTASDAKRESVYERVMRTGVLRCTYIVWPPFITKDVETGKLGGVAHDYTEALAAALGLKVEWALEGDLSTYIESVRSKRVDAECSGGFPTPERTKFVDYTDPYAYVPEYVYARDGDTRFDGRPDLIDNPKTVFAGIEGDTSAQNPARIFPKATLNTLSSSTPYSDLVLNLVTKKADLIATDMVTAVDYNKNNASKIRKVPLESPVNLALIDMAVGKGEDELKSTINTTTRIMLGNGTIERILKKYDPSGDVFLRLRQPYQDAGRPE